jgi:hypothetical protein
MFDSQPQGKSPIGYSWSNQVKQDVIQKGSDITLRISANQQWLIDPKRKYPVTIDPTIVIQPPPTGAQASQDAMINNSTPITNYDGSWKLSVGADPTQTARSLVKFDLSAVPQGVQVNYAQLNLYYDQNFCVGCSTTDNLIDFSIHRVLQDWNPETVTWNQAKTGVPWTSTNKGGTYSASLEATTHIVDDNSATGAYERNMDYFLQCTRSRRR